MIQNSQLGSEREEAAEPAVPAGTAAIIVSRILTHSKPLMRWEPRGPAKHTHERGSERSAQCPSFRRSSQVGSWEGDRGTGSQ